jgi:thioredoxin-dependent peroxiredoxin
MMIRRGQRKAQSAGWRQAPNFILPAQSGAPVSLGDFLGKTDIVLYFYPKDRTSGCTAEACAFRDSYEVFMDAGAEVMGISSDSVESHRQFALQHRLPFTLVLATWYIRSSKRRTGE